MKIIDKMKLKDGKEVVFRYPKMSDAKGCMEYVNSLVEENAMISRTEKLTLSQEKKKFEEFISDIKKKEIVMLIVEINNKVAGMADVRKHREQSLRHVGHCGIGLAKEYRGLGIGKKMMISLMNLSRKELGIEILTLGVFNTNEKAIKLYEGLGFKKYGQLPNGLKKHGKYSDDVFMYKVLK